MALDELRIAKLRRGRFIKQSDKRDIDNLGRTLSSMYELRGVFVFRDPCSHFGSKLGRKPHPDAVRVVYDYEQQFLPAVTMFDMQLAHATKCRLPSPDFPGEEGWYFNFGDAEGTTEQAFSLTHMISQGR